MDYYKLFPLLNYKLCEINFILYEHGHFRKFIYDRQDAFKLLFGLTK